jgi:hypothetical protein
MPLRECRASGVSVKTGQYQFLYAVAAAPGAIPSQSLLVLVEKLVGELLDFLIGHVQHMKQFTGAPLGGRPTGYVFRPDETQHVVYAGTDGHIHELWWDNSGWHHNDLTIATHAPPAGGDPTGYEFTPNVGQGTQRVVYTSSDHHIIQLQWK